MDQKKKSASGRFARECIVDALLVLTKEKPLSAITVSELCDRAGVSRMTFYRNYASKEEVFSSRLLELLEEYGKEELDKIESIEDMNALSKYLVTDGIPDPDLIIRTSGEERISNYLLWQGAYSELLFVKKMWPDFGKEDFFAALDEYAARDRRYGKVK